MDPTDEIKARLPIEELVGQYCQLKKKGRGFVCLCPFHNDTHPSMQVSPDKGIAYCFACQSGGDIFSFYQLIEGVDFRQGLKDLAERTGVTLPEVSMPKHTKDEKDRLRECLEAANKFYKKNLESNKVAQEYIKKRKLPKEQVEMFEIGSSPDSFSATYEHLLKEGFSKSEIISVGLGIQKDLKEGKIYDRFRNRLMFPIHDNQGNIVGFGGRTLGEDDAKYINSSEGPLYNKSKVLYGLHYAKEVMRESKAVLMVEGYFDVLACHRVGVRNVVAVSGTALTEQHAKILARSCEKAVLCLDQDRAGQEAAERAFHLCSAEGLHVQVVTIDQKDPDDAANADPEGFKKALKENSKPYLEYIYERISDSDLSSAELKRQALKRILPLIQSLPTSVEQEDYITKAAGLLGTTEVALKEDLKKLPKEIGQTDQKEPEAKKGDEKKDAFSKVEIALGFFFFYPSLLNLLDQLIEPEEEFALALYQAFKNAPDAKKLTVEMLDLAEEFRERASILQLFCEHHSLNRWSESLAAREIKKNCMYANQELLRKKQSEITRKLVEARKAGKKAEEQQLSTQYHQLLKLSKMAM